MNSFFAYFSRLKFIKRWGLMRNVWPENDAEHTLQTVAIAHGLAVIRKEIFHEEYEKIEDMARKRLLETLPKEMQNSYKPYVVDMEKDELWPLAKAADIMSAYLKCAEELNAGNVEFKKAYDETKKKLNELNLKEVDWFIEHFAESFKVTLDEMD